MSINIKVLLVEDDPNFGSIMKSYLELNEYVVELKKDGKQGLDAVQKDSFDICILDVMMPEMDGFTLAKEVKKLHPDLKRHAQLTEDESKLLDFQVGKFTFTFTLRTLTLDDHVQSLSPKEAKLLRMLCESRDGILLRKEALVKIWGDDNYFNGRSMDVFLARLRKYLKPDPAVEIANIHGNGFRLNIGE
ncbi:MAG: response regulator transcription factor [Bacteroidales bacterium]|nr:response regulator transcription factor [Bacteroidales bacterium]